MIPDCLRIFCAVCEIAFIFAIIIVHFIPYEFSEKKMKPFFRRH